MSLEVFGATLTWDTLLSGAIGGLVVFIATVIYQELKDYRDRERLTAKERLERIYGPLLLILDAGKALNNSDQERFFYTKDEERRIDDLLFQYYHLIEEKRKGLLLHLYSYRKFKTVPEKEMIQAIKDGYAENLKKAGYNRGN